MPKLALNKPIPDFKLPATGEKSIKLSELKGNNLVLYFYPKDNTSGCTLEARVFNTNRAKFKRLNTIILGVSRDSLKSHDSFRKKLRLKFDLLSDEKAKVCRLFGVIKLKNMYGHRYQGIERSTFLIDATGVLRHEWRKVSVSGHVDEVLKVLKTLL